MATERTKLIVVITFVAAVVALFLLGLAALGSLDEITDEALASPNGGYVARGKSSYTEIGSKWDGQGVTLVKSWIPFNEVFATTAFRSSRLPASGGSRDSTRSLYRLLRRRQSG